MPNGTIYKALAKGSAAVILGVLFFYFMQAHFARDDKVIEVIQDSTKSNVQVISALEKLNDTVDRFNYTISSPQVQAELQASIVNRKFPYELDPLMTPATSSSEEEWEDFDEPNL